MPQKVYPSKLIQQRCSCWFGSWILVGLQMATKRDCVWQSIQPILPRLSGKEPLLARITRFFKTGKPPVSSEETLVIYTFMEVADESKLQGGLPISVRSVFSKARSKNLFAIMNAPFLVSVNRKKKFND